MYVTANGRALPCCIAPFSQRGYEHYTLGDATQESLRAIWIDAGTRDEWFLDLGAEAFRATLHEIGVPDDVIHFELFDGSHMGVDYRYPLSLAWLCQRIAE